MSCECNETPFKKLRECWSRYNKKDMQGECECCCSGPKPKSRVKGKFGIAYVIDTPNRKCKPCGWEVEFNDTLSEVENNCKKMMNWVTCPPLGECQNNQTNMCRCSEDAKQLLNNLQPTCCRCAVNNDDLCQCCQQKKEKNEGNCCCKKEQVSCCEKPINKNQCLCLKANDNSGQYYSGATDRNQCCCKVPDNKNQCCCNIPKNKNQCYCRVSDNKNQCCCRGADTKNQCCLKSKQKSNYSRPTDGQEKYFESVKRCTECCCTIANKEKTTRCCCKLQEKDSDEECCCRKATRKPKCCCKDDSDSQSSLGSCECTKQNRRDCNCNCSECKCDKTKRSRRKSQKSEEKRKGEKKEKIQSKESKDSKDKVNTKPRQSKNLASPEPKKERYKHSEKTPFTISTHETPKKEPDKSQDLPDKNFYEELSEKVHNIKKRETEDNLEVIIDPEDTKPEYLSTKLSLDKAHNTNILMSSDKNITENNENIPQTESEIKNIEYEDTKLNVNMGQTDLNDGVFEGTKNKSVEETLTNEENIVPENDLTEETLTNKENNPTEETLINKPTTQKKPTLLQRIKLEHKKEMDAIHPQQKIETTVA